MGAVRENIQKNLRFYLQRNNLSQKRFAEKVGVTPNAVGAWINGRTVPDFDSLPKICRILKIDVGELLGMKKITDPNKKFLLYNYKLLNTYGQEKLIEVSNDLVLIDKYTTADKNSGEIVSGALDEITDEQICEELKYKE